jgi:glutathionyl-hydroquinone reductase
MASHAFLVPPGNTAQPTWLDIRLFHTLVRFDPVYVVYFKTNAKACLN